MPTIIHKTPRAAVVAAAIAAGLPRIRPDLCATLAAELCRMGVKHERRIRAGRYRGAKVQAWEASEVLREANVLGPLQVRPVDHGANDARWATLFVYGAGVPDEGHGWGWALFTDGSGLQVPTDEGEDEAIEPLPADQEDR